MKKSIFGKVGAAAVVLTLVTASLVGGTFAKYTSTATGTGTAQVAKWAIAMKEGDNAITGDTFTFTLENSNANAVSKKDTIAPGSDGEIKFAINGENSEVGYSYIVNADISLLGGIPIKFYSDAAKSHEITFTDNKAEVAKGDVELADVGTEKTASIYWAWDSTSTDAKDTTVGIAGTAGTITVTITAEQYIKSETPPAA